MSGNTVAEFCYMIASAAVTWFVAWGAAWSYPQGADTIWLVGAATLVAVGVLGARDVGRMQREGAAA